MEAFVARQPIFDQRQRVFAYELLFRSSLDDLCSVPDPAGAASGVSSCPCSPPDLERLTGGRPAFVDFTRRVLEQNLAKLFARDWLVVELLKNIEPDPATLSACRDLKEAGYTLALDDFEYQPHLEPLLELADIVKVDFRQSGPDERSATIARVRSSGARLLAERVETRDEFDQARALGFDYYQGYFFSRPVMVSGQNIPSWKTQALQLIRKMQEPNIDYRGLAAIVREEVSLTYRLLRYINSPYFGVRVEVSSVERALTLLGEDLIRKWVMLASLETMSQDGPAELARMSFIRALFCESLAVELGETEQQSDFFLVGLFSLLDVILGRPLAEVLAELPLSRDVTQALAARDGLIGQVLEVAEYYEKGDWDRSSLAADKIGLDENSIPRVYLEAVTGALDLTSD
ncbi:MAG: HDOD domain-containing protein [Proteobacteria bacterium]|nr:HDOD domain-containing protein [Pseudomonadota bacterium]MBU1740248.1 HDOD domain-containing protein [Pseudomonadota bacterium]